MIIEATDLTSRLLMGDKEKIYLFRRCLFWESK